MTKGATSHGVAPFPHPESKLISRHLPRIPHSSPAPCIEWLKPVPDLATPLCRLGRDRRPSWNAHLFRTRKFLGAPVRRARLRDLVRTLDPCLRREIVPVEHVVQPVRLVLREPALLVQLAAEHIAVAQVRSARVDVRGDLAQAVPGTAARLYGVVCVRVEA